MNQVKAMYRRGTNLARIISIAMPRGQSLPEIAGVGATSHAVRLPNVIHLLRGHLLAVDLLRFSVINAPFPVQHSTATPSEWFG